MITKQSDNVLELKGDEKDKDKVILSVAAVSKVFPLDNPKHPNDGIVDGGE